ARFQFLGDIGMDPQHYILMFQMLGDLAHLNVDLVADGRDGLHVTGGLAIRTGCSNGPLERLLDALAGDRHQPEIIELQGLRWCAVVPELLFESLHDALAVAPLIHVDEVNDDDAAQIAKPDLPDNFFDRIDVRLDDRVFQPLRLPDVLAGI